ncbi:MAG: hypothetical protein CL912_29155 [Deltaproteobacteria bacterium]|nr:hypothetical protein [Deltaproteobacteria bacterium]
MAMSRVVITTIVPFRDIHIGTRWPNDFGEDLDPSPAVVTLPCSQMDIIPRYSRNYLTEEPAKSTPHAV